MPAAEHDEQLLAASAADLAERIDGVLEGWTVRCVRSAVEAAGLAVDDHVLAAAAVAGARCRAEVSPAVRALLAQDLDDQTTTPLALLRSAVVFPTSVLTDLGVPPAERDEFQVRAFPADRYGLSPANFGDVDESLAEPGIVWGAAKAHVHLARHRPVERPSDRPAD